MKLQNSSCTLFLMLLLLMIPSCNQKSKDRIMAVKIYEYEGSVEKLFSNS